MANGKPGDHPLTDILTHKLEVYCREADELIRRIGDLCSRRDLYEWWERKIGWSNDRELALSTARIRLEELTQRARENG